MMKTDFRRQALSNLPYWIAGLTTGLFASAYAIVFKSLTLFSSHIFEMNFFLWASLVPIGFAISFYLVKRYSPESSGSGIPQVMAAIHHYDVHPSPWLHRLLGLKVVVIKILSSLVSVVVGGAIGREGPTIQIGASVFNFMGRFIPEAVADNSKKRRALILAGGAAGIAAAFNTPLGGIVFAIEELATDAFREFRTTVLLAVIVSGMTAQWILGSYLYLGHPAIQEVHFYSIMASIVVAIAGGLAGGYFGTSLFALVKIRRKAHGTKKQVYWIAALSLLFIALAYLSHGLSIGPGTEGITDILNSHPHTPFWLPMVRFAANQISYLVGGAGGIFSPALSIGATLGSWGGDLFFNGGPGSNVLVIVGMISFLTGMSHAPLTSLVLVMEMIDQPMITFPMMLGSLIAYGITRQIHSQSFYERMSEYYAPHS
jgi:H+/Cl- antiporter ClcA